MPSKRISNEGKWWAHAKKERVKQGLGELSSEEQAQHLLSQTLQIEKQALIELPAHVFIEKADFHNSPNPKNAQYQMYPEYEKDFEILKDTNPDSSVLVVHKPTENMPASVAFRIAKNNIVK